MLRHNLSNYRSDTNEIIEIVAFTIFKGHLDKIQFNFIVDLDKLIYTLLRRGYSVV